MTQWWYIFSWCYKLQAHYRKFKHPYNYCGIRHFSHIKSFPPCGWIQALILAFLTVSAGKARWESCPAGLCFCMLWVGSLIHTLQLHMAEVFFLSLPLQSTYFYLILQWFCVEKWLSIHPGHFTWVTKHTAHYQSQTPTSTAVRGHVFRKERDQTGKCLSTDNTFSCNWTLDCQGQNVKKQDPQKWY